MSLLPVGIGSAAGGYQIERSLRFNSADTAYLNRTPGSAGNRKTWTWSGWIKRSSAKYSLLFAAGNTNDIWNSSSTTQIGWAANENSVSIYNNGAYFRTTTQVFRDFSAWGHLVVAIDTTQATAANRVKMYWNGEQITAFSTSNDPTQNLDTFVNAAHNHVIGGQQTNVANSYYNGYVTEVNFIDGSALTPSSFGETNPTTGVWQPKKYTGSYSGNSFYLNFSDNSGTTSTTLGKDSSGLGNNWTPNNFSVTAGAGNDSLVDTPTPYGTDTGVGGEIRGNYCTFNSVKPVTNSITFSNGNLQYKPGSSWSTTTYVEGTIGVLGGSTGKYYWEMSADQTGAFWTAGVALQNNTIGGSNIGTTGSVMIYDNAKYVNGTSTSSYLTSLSANEVLGVALDAATGKVWFRDSGGWLGSGDPAAGTNETGIPTGFSGATLVPVSQANSASTVTANFGQRPYSYAAPTGFKALCTQNLPEPTIKDGGDYFNAVLYTGTGSVPLNVNGVGFQPDAVWLKRRDTTGNNRLMGSYATNSVLITNTTGVEGLVSFTFTSDGFSTGTTNVDFNASGGTYVAWNWKANGAGSSNTAGTTSATVSVNTTSGFSIITATTPSTYTSHTVGHGLGVTPAFIIYKERNQTSNWQCWHRSLSGATNLIQLNTTTGEQSGSFWGTHTSTVIACGGGIQSATSSPLVMYAFAPVAGYSAFGSYTGNGSSDGVFVYLGFRARYLMLKSSSGTGGWVLLDTARDTYNDVDNYLYANSSAADAGSSNVLDINSNGFKIRNSWTDINGSGSTYIYAAFAENPFKYSLAR